MRHSPHPAWHDAVSATRKRDWPAVAGALARAPRIDLAYAAEDDYLRPAVLAIAIHAPRPVADMLRLKVRAADGTLHQSHDWARHLVRGMALHLATRVAMALGQPRWPQLCAAFHRLVSVPRVASAQATAVEQIGRLLLTTAIRVEAQFPIAILRDDELGLLHRTAAPRVQRVLGGFRLRLVALCLSSLAGSPHYLDVAREILFDALARLNWPTLRQCGWLSYTPLPGGADGTWEPLLQRLIVRAVCRPPCPDDPHIDTTDFN